VRTILRWLGLVFALIVARILPSLLVLVAILWLAAVGLRDLGLQPPTAAQIAQRLDAASRDFAPLVQRIRAATAIAAPAASASSAAASDAQSQR